MGMRDRLVELPVDELGQLLEAVAKDIPSIPPATFFNSRGPTKGILRVGLGYMVKLGWQTLTVRTAVTPCLKQALEWHAQLIALRGVASQTLAAGRSFEDAAMIFEGSEPYWFQSDQQINKIRCVTPLHIMDLRTTLSMRTELQAVAAKAGRSTDSGKTSVARVRKSFDKRIDGFRRTVPERRAILYKMLQATATGASTHFPMLGA